MALQSQEECQQEVEKKEKRTALYSMPFEENTEDYEKKRDNGEVKNCQEEDRMRSSSPIRQDW